MPRPLFECLTDTLCYAAWLDKVQRRTWGQWAAEFYAGTRAGTVLNALRCCSHTSCTATATLRSKWKRSVTCTASGAPLRAWRTPWQRAWFLLRLMLVCVTCL